MRAGNILALAGKDSAALGAAVAETLHIPFASIVADKCEVECREITEYLATKSDKFSVLAVSAGAAGYPPSALILAARATFGALFDASSAFADFVAPQDATVTDIVSAWLSPEVLSSFSGPIA